MSKGERTTPRCLLVQNLYEILFILLSYRLSEYAPSQKKRLSCDFATKPLRETMIRCERDQRKRATTW